MGIDDEITARFDEDTLTWNLFGSDKFLGKFSHGRNPRVELSGVGESFEIRTGLLGFTPTLTRNEEQLLKARSSIFTGNWKIRIGDSDLVIRQKSFTVLHDTFRLFKDGQKICTFRKQRRGLWSIRPTASIDAHLLAFVFWLVLHQPAGD